MITECPGANIHKNTPTLDNKTCPECGHGVELYSSDEQAPCAHCGHILHSQNRVGVHTDKRPKDRIGDLQ